ncbi:hypothetical protein LOAG_07788 [Loa loa]|uniref:Uncharacterized protein n=1 Tax=Loa loa TaxID=7209 RepID=A0A1S0TV33_LOALO|nr:hypothetical protein LOAG_07788 [Loa loa]EFO20699.1 hypothetical protein LOAG_07788 [Loa loa]
MEWTVVCYGDSTLLNDLPLLWDEKVSELEKSKIKLAGRAKGKYLLGDMYRMKFRPTYGKDVFHKKKQASDQPKRNTVILTQPCFNVTDMLHSNPQPFVTTPHPLLIWKLSGKTEKAEK